MSKANRTPKTELRHRLRSRMDFRIAGWRSGVIRIMPAEL